MAKITMDMVKRGSSLVLSGSSSIRIWTTEPCVKSEKNGFTSAG